MRPRWSFCAPRRPAPCGWRRANGPARLGARPVSLDRCARVAALAGLTGLGLLGAGCDDGTPARLAQRLDPIRGGRLAPEHTGVFGLALTAGAGGLCSGSLIAPNLILTAQHCVADIASPQVTCGRTPFGALFAADSIFASPDAQLAEGGRWYGVREVHVPVQRADTCGHDIAVVILNQNVPAAVASPLPLRLDDHARDGERFSAVGYGHIGDDSGAGVRRVIDNREVLCAGPTCGGSDEVTTAELVANDGTCQGDSGGPALDAQGRVFGALSRGGDGCVFPVYSATAAWAPWLMEMGARAAQLGGYAPAAWTGVVEPDSDNDGVPDRLDNCPGEPNADQRDLDEDGLGDVCDPRQDRDCAVCRACTRDLDCGPGATCGADGTCALVCGDDADCPDPATTRCVGAVGNGLCLNADHLTAGRCAAGFVCGETLTPEPEPEPEPTPEPEPEPTPEPEPDDPDVPALPGEEPPPIRIVTVSEPTTLRGGCAAVVDDLDGPPGATWAWLLVGGLVLRRRR